MNSAHAREKRSWRQSPYGLAGFWMASLMVWWLLLRLVLFFSFKPASAPVLDSFLCFFSGLYRDAIAALWLSLPLVFWLLIIPNRWFAARWHRVLFWSACLLFWFGEIFLLAVEYFFFEEFRSRFNTVAVDYLQYPKEVFVNIWDSYHVGIVILICLVLAASWVLAVSRWFSGMWERPFPAKTLGVRTAALGVLSVVLVPLLITAGTLTGVMHSPFRLSGAHVSEDRTLNEIANNGQISFFAAAWTHDLDYTAFYKTMPREEAYARARRLLREHDGRFLENGSFIRRAVAGDPARPRLNVVIFLEESLGSEFWGSLGRKEPTLTPEMDHLAAREGLLFTNIYACGNRTVRGMEGVLSSFPPLPGESIVKRNLSDNVETTARILKRDGYSTMFLYGGRGVFDGMRSFALHNGYDRFIEQKDFEHPTFTTIWGVCDEDLYDRTIQECQALSRAGRPFFATVLSVSNHKPYTYPAGRISEDPEQRRRENAVKYSDYSLGRFFRLAKNQLFWTNTIFVVVADHGARVYGEQTIPIHSYEIPLLIAGPAVVKEPRRIGQLGSSLDVSPTVLGLIGRPYETLFFGQDLLKCRPQDGRALLNHNRDIGLLTRDRLVILGLMQTAEFYAGDPKRAEMVPLPGPGEADVEIEKNAIALFQVADELYVHQKYRLDNSWAPALTATAPPQH